MLSIYVVWLVACTTKSSLNYTPRLIIKYFLKYLLWEIAQSFLEIQTLWSSYLEVQSHRMRHHLLAELPSCPQNTCYNKNDCFCNNWLDNYINTIHGISGSLVTDCVFNSANFSQFQSIKRSKNQKKKIRQHQSEWLTAYSVHDKWQYFVVFHDFPQWCITTYNLEGFLMFVKVSAAIFSCSICHEPDFWQERHKK